MALSLLSLYHSWDHYGADPAPYPQIMKYAEQRIPTLNEYCVVCDEQHVFQNGSMLKVWQCWGTGGCACHPVSPSLSACPLCSRLCALVSCVSSPSTPWV